MRIYAAACLGALCLGLTAAHAAAPAPDVRGVAFFEKRVRPVLAEKCWSCHGPTKQRAGLRLDSRAALLKGGDSGPVVVAGKPDQSLLLQVVRHDGDVKMPPKAKLGDETVAALATWVKMGAPWPVETVDPGHAPRTVAEVRKRHWSFQPVKKLPLPAVTNRAWVRTPLDAFVLARLEAKGLKPAAPADRRTLIRRAHFDLLGLPPTPEEVAAFEADRRPDAYARLVDQLLARPEYGERWARHWLDVARYADTKGYVFTDERRFPYAYTYRDYVIRAFNTDLPYDRFVTEQLAADLLPLGDDTRPLAALGFLTLGRRFLNNTHDVIDDRIDVTMRGLQGLTVTCARCHDHKFDPIPQKDYYSLYGVFASCAEPRELPLLGRPERTPAYVAFEKELHQRQAKVTAYLQEQRAELLPRLRARVGEYLAAAADPAWRRPRGEQAAGDLNGRLVFRWREFLAENRKRHDPVFAAWHAFAALPRKEFAARAVAVARRIAANGDPKKRIHPLVARTFAGPPPASMAEVARRYGTLLADADQRRLLDGAGSPLDIPPGEIERYFNRAKRDRLRVLRKRVDTWRATAPGAPPRAMVLNDLPAPREPHVFLRGNPGNPGPRVPRQYLEVLAGDHRKPFTRGSGRLELARAIANRDNPLTARVLVNRVWLHHFGQGLVRTPSDFGLRGEPPTHPELLDYLAATFVENGWSIKKLHRLILLSNVYRQASDGDPRLETLDPENRLLAHHSRRRLDFEAMRDALLAVAGRLDATRGGPAVDLTTAPFTTRRSVYGFIDRQNLPGLFRTFDFASPDASTPQRHTTTVPQQALFLMNNGFVVEQARHFAARPDVTALAKDEARIDRMHRLAYGRAAEPEEVRLGLRFLATARKAAGGERLSAWEQYAQVLLLANEFVFVD